MTVNERVDAGTKLLIRAALIVGLLYLLYLIRSVVLLTLLSVLTSAALVPAIGKLQQWKFSRTAAVIIVYTLLFSVCTISIAVFLPLFFSEVKEFLRTWPLYASRLDSLLGGLAGYLSSIGIDFNKDQLMQNIGGNISEGFTHIYATTINLFQGFIHAIGFFFLALYLSLEEKGIEKFFLLLTPKEYHAQALSIASRMQGKVSQWLFGQAILMLIAFVMYYAGLSLLGVPYALAIAFFGGLMEILPYIGPVLAAIPAIIIGLLSSPVLGFSALVFYVVAHQVEAHIIAPQVMKHSAGLSPVALILAILIGLELGGALGIILSVPITMVLSVFVEDILVKRSA
jgi:predicted PurR-regulated permease PerM